MKIEEEYLEKISELELQYEELEQDYFLHISFLFGFILQLYLGLWLISIFLPLSFYIVAWKCFAKKPFTSNVNIVNGDENIE